MSDPVPSSAIYDATAGGISVLQITGGNAGDVPTRQSDGTYIPAAVSGITEAEVASLIAASVGNYLPLTGGTLSGNLGVTNIVGPGGSTTLVLNNAGTGGTYLQENGATRAWIGGSGVGIYTAAYPINSNLYDLGLTTRYWRKLFVSCIVPLSADLIIRDGTTAQAVRIDKTYTSDTNCEFLRVGFTGTNYDLCSRVGSAGGSNQPIRLGHLAADGTTFAGLTVATSGALTTTSGQSISSSGIFPASLTLTSGFGAGNNFTFRGYNISTPCFSIHMEGSGVWHCRHRSPGIISWSSSADATGAADTAIGRNAAGVVEINNGTAGTYRDLICRAITASGNLLLQNSTTAVLAEFSKTYTSSTNREYFNIGFTGTNYDLCSRVGSAGGSNQPIRVGHIAADGTTFAGMTVDTTGNLDVQTMSFTGKNGTISFTTISDMYLNNAHFHSAFGVWVRGSGRVCGIDGTTTSLSLYTSSVIRATATSTGFESFVTVKAPASTIALASLNIPSGTAPTAPNNGDIWSDGSDLKVRLGGVTYTLTKA